MSVQTIIHTSLLTLLENSKKGTIDNANKLLLKKRFELGEGYCEDKQFDNSMICEIIGTNNCNLTNYINEVIECGPDEDFVPRLPESCEKPVKASKEALYDLWLSQGNSGSLSDFLDLLLRDEGSCWNAINW